MGHELRKFLSGAVGPELRSRGWARPKASEFWKQSEAGDAVGLYFQRSDGTRSPLISFYVQYTVSPLPGREFEAGHAIESELRDATLDAAGGVVGGRISPPAQVNLATLLGEQRKYEDRWAFFSDEQPMVDACAHALLSTLQDLVPTLERLLDRPTLLAELKSPSLPNFGRAGASFVELLFLLDSGDLDRVPQLLSEELKRSPPVRAEMLEAWVRHKAPHLNLTQR